MLCSPLDSHSTGWIVRTNVPNLKKAQHMNGDIISTGLTRGSLRSFEFISIKACVTMVLNASHSSKLFIGPVILMILSAGPHN